jgi:hypothetical protein
VGGAPNIGYIEEVWERKGSVSVPEPTSMSYGLLGSASGQLLVTCTSPHGLSNGDWVELFGSEGFDPPIDGSWPIATGGLLNTQFYLLGCYAQGAMTSGGHLYRFTEDWSGPLAPHTSTKDFPRTPQSSVGMYCYADGYLNFPPQSGDWTLTKDLTELKIVYSLSASLPDLNVPYTWSVPAGTLTKITVASNVGTVTFPNAHNLAAGDQITVSGATVSTNLNKTYTVATISLSNPLILTIATASVPDATYTDSTLTITSIAPYVRSPLGIDDSLNYLSHGTAAGYLLGKGTRASVADQEGKANEALLALLRDAVRQMQRGEGTVLPPFRQKRNLRPFVW